MSRASIWRGEVLASALASAKAGQGSALLREAAIENRLAALREVALTLLEAVDSLRGSQPSRDQSLRLQDEVQRFESDLIRTALERTGGNQARAARLLGVKHTTLNAKIKRYQIQCDSHANEGAKVVGDREIAA
jgi:transcriptional regulator with GAF, ATPase, and Fis domain